MLMTVLVAGCGGQSPDMNLDVKNPGDQIVSVPFTLSGKATFDAGGLDFTSTWTASGPLDPSVHRSDQKDVSASFTDSVTFTCLAAGRADIVWEVKESDGTGNITSVDVALACKDKPGDTPQPVETAAPAETEQPTGTPRAAAKPRTLVSDSVGPVGGGTVEGEVQLAAAQGGAAGTDIVVEAKGPAEPLPVTLEKGGCDKRGSIVQALSPMTNGTSSSTLTGALADYLTGEYSVHVATSAKPDVDVACGVIARGRIIALSAGTGGDQTPADVALIDQAPYGTDVSVFSTPETVSSVQPVAIVKGRCSGSGPVAFPLSDARRGRSTTTVDAKFDTLLSGGYSVRIGRSAAAPDQIVACGDLTP